MKKDDDLERLRSRMLPGETVETMLMRLGGSVDTSDVIDDRTDVEKLQDRIEALNDEVHELAGTVDLRAAADDEIEGLREAADHLSSAVETLIEAVAVQPDQPVH